MAHCSLGCGQAWITPALRRIMLHYLARYPGQLWLIRLFDVRY
jgi:hypothetical protein